jgi:uncharacterized protein YggE
MVGAGHAIGPRICRGEGTRRDDDGARRVTVEGRGVVRAAPDAATIQIGIDARSTTVADARASAARQMTAAIEALLARGVARADLQTEFYRVSLVWNRDAKGQPTTVWGYSVHNELKATIRDLDRLGDVLDDALAAGVNRLSGPTFFIERPQALADEARRLAAVDARRRAEILAGASGAELGRIVSIVEQENGGHRPIYRAAYAASEMSAPDVTTPIESGLEEIAIEIQTIWELD